MSAELPTPIPLGSPHFERPPMFADWRPNRSKLGIGERRDYSRRAMECDIWLIEPSTQFVMRCRTMNLSDAGLYASAPIGYGVAVGQRYEVRILDSRGDRQISPRLAPSLGFASVIRLDMNASGEGDDRVGLVLRFDVPQLLPV